MKPCQFAEANTVLRKPDSLTDEQCQSLHVCRTGEHCVSRWRASLLERLYILFVGKVWLSVWSGNTQPPVLVTTEYPFLKAKEGYK